MNTDNLYTITDSVGDTSLWTSFKTGDARAFGVIYERYIGLLTNYGLRIGSDRDLVKDAIHDMFVDLWKNRANLGPTDSIRYYLIKALRRNLIKKIRADQDKRSEDITRLNTDQLFEFSHELTLMKAELAREKINCLHHELDKLSSRQKEVLFLRFYSGFSPDEIAQILEINPQSVYNLIHRGLETLRENMKYTAISTLLLLLSNPC
ncbi:MAG: sigma-70 family RNA polymerase sigma factor [Cyclobacteriaceae bacterium]